MQKRTLKIILIASFSIGLLGEFITTLIWWTNIKPWYSHGKDNLKNMYTAIYITWVSSLIIFIIFMLDVSFMSKNENIDKIMNFTYAASIIPLISGAMCFSYANESLAMYWDNDKAYEIKCYNGLLESLKYIEAWADLKGKHDKYEKWSEKIGKKIMKMNSKGELDHFTGYLCKTFGIPTLVFIIVQSLSMCYYTYTITTVELFVISETEKENTDLNENSGANQIENNENGQQKVIE